MDCVCNPSSIVQEWRLVLKGLNKDSPGLFCKESRIERGWFMDLPELKVCIFDVNGVLIDSNLANAQAMGQAFTDDPILHQHIAELYLQLTGIDRGSKIRTIQERVIKRPFKEKEFELRWERYKDLARLSMRQAPLVRGCKEVLAELGKRGIIRVALSNTPLVELRETLASHGLESFLLDIIRGGGDWPKSESLVRLLQEFQFEPDKCHFIGDGRGDLAAARDAGVSFVAIDPGRGEFEDEEGFDGPYRHVADWAQKVLGIECREEFDRSGGV
jgi:phosphoglycolate phosphatase-like HAD superfamily hydrolase